MAIWWTYRPMKFTWKYTIMNGQPLVGSWFKSYQVFWRIGPGRRAQGRSSGGYSSHGYTSHFLLPAYGAQLGGDPLIEKRDVTDRLPRMTLWSKNVTSLTGCQEWPSDPKCDKTDRLPEMTLWRKNVTSLTRGIKQPFRCLDYEWSAKIQMMHDQRISKDMAIWWTYRPMKFTWKHTIMNGYPLVGSWFISYQVFWRNMKYERLQRKYHVQDKYVECLASIFPAHIEILSLSGTPLWFDYSLQLSLIKCGWWWWCWSWRWEYDCDIELSKAPVVWNSLWWPNSLQSITIAQQNTLSPLLGTLSKPMLTTLT